MDVSGQQYQILKLFRSQGVGPVIFRKLIAKYGSASDAMDAFSELNQKYKKKLVVASNKALDQELEGLKKIKGTLLFLGDERFPTALKFMYDCPPVITVLGDAKLLGKEQVSIVGNRQASSMAMKFTQKISAELCTKGYVITSGLARGIDSSAHQGALNSGGQTIGVLAGGVDHIYPPENKKMYQNMIEVGAIVSEMPLGTVPTANHFPRRNRIVSGLSLGTFVVEAAKRSGSLITARLAAEQGREVFAMPGSPMDKRSSGPNYLIQNGATLVQTVDDIVDNLPELVVGYHRYQQKLDLQLKVSEEILDLEADESAPLNSDMRHTETMAGDSLQQGVLNLLSSTPTPFDDLIRTLNVEESRFFDILSELELEGKVERQISGLVLLNS
jgi:DNA processing protein